MIWAKETKFVYCEFCSDFGDIYSSGFFEFLIGEIILSLVDAIANVNEWGEKRNIFQMRKNTRAPMLSLTGARVHCVITWNSNPPRWQLHLQRCTATPGPGAHFSCIILLSQPRLIFSSTHRPNCLIVLTNYLINETFCNYFSSIIRKCFFFVMK